MKLPVFHSWAERRALVERWGLPNAYPTDEERESLAFFRTRREMFVDDDDNGRPVAVFDPTPAAVAAHRRAARLRAMARSTEFETVARRLLLRADALDRIA